MKALQFAVSIPQFLALKLVGGLKRLYLNGPLATIRLVDIPEPVLPSPAWVKVKTRMCGICASDLNLIFLRDSPTASPFTSFPCVLGHEISGEIVDTGSQVTSLKKGDRVTVAPHLNCVPRAIEPLCSACRFGHVGSCENFANGSLSPGMFIGICKDTGGGMGEFFVAHESQVYKLPDFLSDSVGIMIEPLAVALQAVLNNPPKKGDRVLVVGGGVIGSLIVHVIRSLDIDCSISVSEPSKFHADLAQKAGADVITTPRKLFKHTHKETAATLYKPMLGKRIAMGGFERVFDVVGSSDTLNTAMRCMAAQGCLSVVGIGHDVKLDLTPMWLKTQTIKGVFSYGFVQGEGGQQHVFEIALDMLLKKKISAAFLEEMVTHRFAIHDYPALVRANLYKARHRAVKTAMVF
jgi:(R,R)-butanediol dehydrogenase / meso-butanediol dehydrogenase / diacetyl reductase